MSSSSVAVPVKQEEVVFLRDFKAQNVESETTLEKAIQDLPLTEDTTCGYGFFQSKHLQRFANIKSFVVLFGVVGSIFSMTNSYFNGILTTVEKRFKIPSKNIGVIMVGLDCTNLLASWFISYYGGRKHRPRWLGFGLISIMLYCLLTSLPHFLYGPGTDALQLTKEYAESRNVSIGGADKSNTVLCNYDDSPCEEKDGHLAPQLIFFLAQIVSGFGDSIYWMLGSTYMDDNAPKSEAPFLLSLSFFTRMLGPALGYSLASSCLKIYVAPYLTPLITNEDPRWIGAWWLGWIVIALILIIPSIAISCFPRELPAKAARRLLEKKKAEEINQLPPIDQEELHETSFQDMKKTFMRLCNNKVFMYTNMASILFIMGFMPFWIFSPKYIEIQFRQTASVASLVNGTMGIVAAALGVLISGAVISKYKPRTRYMAAWNTIVGVISALGFVVYMFIGCPANETAIAMNIQHINSNSTCNVGCHCDYVSYTPVCGEDLETYISPCHAGCLEESEDEDNRKIYKDCSCIESSNSTNRKGYATDGPCPVDCFHSFVTFVAVSCILSFIGSTSRASNFLVSVRCVDEKDKSASLGFNNTMLCLFAFIPVPIISGLIFDKFCLVWGKTCESDGNCWLYDSENLRFFLCTTAAIFVMFGSCFDFLVWIHAKDIKCFDDEDEQK